MPQSADFTIKNLGEASYDSPLKGESGIVNLVDDSLRIPLDIHQVAKSHAVEESFECAGPREKIYFDPQNVSAAIVTCGGLCPGLNDAIRSIVMQLHYKYGVKRILGVRYGFKGLDPNTEFKPITLSPDDVSKIHEMGGTYLGTSRGAVSTDLMVDTLEKYGVNMLFCLGGDGSQRGLHALQQTIEKRGLNIATIGLPKTIDNDISYVYKTFGIDSAVTVAKEAVRCAHSEAESAYNGIGLVKVMGRHAGYIAAMTTLANMDVNFCLIPEVPFDVYGQGGLLDLLEKRIDRRHHAVLVVAEGAGQDIIREDDEDCDPSGNPRLKPIGRFLRDEIRKHFKDKNIPVDLKYIDPSYMIRSVPTNSNDSILAARFGRLAADAAMAGKTDMLIGLWHGHFTHVPLSLVINTTKKIDPKDELWREVLVATGQPSKIKTRDD
ncbi:MAG: ATP-dependent 6-phosphofructokinase [Chlamydiota bacterium]